MAFALGVSVMSAAAAGHTIYNIMHAYCNMCIMYITCGTYAHTTAIYIAVWCVSICTKCGVRSQ